MGRGAMMILFFAPKLRNSLEFFTLIWMSLLLPGEAHQKGEFYVASAYGKLLKAIWDATDTKWSSIWSLPVKQRIRLFLWLVLRQRLMTNVKHYRRGLSSDASCPSCGCGYCKCIEIVTPLQVELWSILIGLQVAWSYDAELLIVQSDNSQAVKMIKDPSAFKHSMHDVSSITA
ncbi:hypothetical protein V6N11_054156 [Hibiscus sabdariffa]|uniref:Reverse transcriptase zinc-binding domain-containing protein n=1 Tax=Hibiscus sabdariffa TaxID=183260 RepID=A0ABR2S3Q2_9ROSI